MFPVIAAVGPFTISSLGLFLFLAFFFGSFEVWRRLREEHFEDKDIFDAIFLSFFGGVIGSRIFYVLLHFSDFGLNPGKWLSLTFSNQASWLGFLVGISICLYFISRRKRWQYYQVMDLIVFSLLLVQMLIRVGQFLDGSFVGRETRLLWGLHFPGLSERRHPLQLYDLMWLLITLLLLVWLEGKYRLWDWYKSARGESKPGILWFSYLGLFSLGQFWFAFLAEKTAEAGLVSGYQLLLLTLFFMSILGIWGLSGKGTFVVALLTFISKFKPIPRVTAGKIAMRQPRFTPIQSKGRSSIFGRRRGRAGVDFK